MTDEPTYTLAEAKAELGRRECATRGHTFDVMLDPLNAHEPYALVCRRCDATYDVTRSFLRQIDAGEPRHDS